MSTSVTQDPLIIAVRDPRSLLGLDESQWDELLKRARRHNLLGRLGFQLEELDLLNGIPEKARERFLGACLWAELNHTGIRHEIHRVLRALEGLDIPIILLKGAAYLMAGLPPSRGRVFTDLDILVPAANLEQVEQTLLARGWEGPEMDAYDQHYYRVWAHEIPPLTHPDRGTEVDVHHTIVPRTSRPKPDVPALVDSAQALDDQRLKVLAPADMVLHSGVHLFHEAFETALRELLDLDDLLRHFGESDGFWKGLVPRARLHGLERPLFYALRYCERILGTSIPSQVMEEAAARAPSSVVRAQMDWLVPRAMVPDTPDGNRHGSRIARWLLYVRSHWLRMPALLLAYHLSVKALRRTFDRLRAVPIGNVD